MAVARKYSARVLRVAPEIGLRGLAAIMALFALCGFNPQALAATYYWDTTATSTWSTGADWSTASMSGGTTGTVPSSGSTVVFDQSAVNGNETVTLSGSTAILGITFANIGTTLIESSTTTPEVMDIGTSGIAISSGAGAVTIGNATDPATITMNGAQSWTNNSASLFTITGAVTDGGSLLTIGAGTGVGGVAILGGISGSGGLTDSYTASMVVLSGSNSYTGVTTVSPGATLQLQANAGNTASGVSYALGANNLTMGAINNSTTTLQLRSDTSVTFNGGNNMGGLGGNASPYGETVDLDVNQLTSAGSNNTLTFAPAGFATLNTIFNITGGNGYTMELGPDTNGNKGTMTYNAVSANLIVNGGITSVSTLTFGGGYNSSVTGAITNGSSTTTLVKTGAGTLTLTGANTYTGATTVNGGTLNLGGGSANGSISSSSVLSLGGGIFSDTLNTSATQTFASTSVNAGGSGVSAASGDTVALGAITRNVGGAVNFSGAGTITTPTANVNGILGGYATYGGANFATSAGNGTTAGAVTAFTAYNQTLGTGGVTVDTTTTDNDTITTVSGNGTGVTLSGNTTINSLTIADTANDTLALGSDSLTFTSGGGLLYAGTGGYTISGTGYIGAGAANEFILDDNSAALTISAPLIGSAGTGAFTKSGAGTVTLSGVETYTGATYVGGGTLTIGGAGQLGSGTYAGNIGISTGATFNYNSSAAQTLSGVISGGGGLTESGAGNLTLSGNNTFTGNVIVNGGTLIDSISDNSTNPAATGVGSSTATGPSRTITVNNGGTIMFGGNNALGNTSTSALDMPTLVINQGGLVETTVSNYNNNFGSIILNGGTLAADNNGYSVSFQSICLFGNVSVIGSGTSTISLAAGATANDGVMLGSNTIFNVAPSASLLVSDYLAPVTTGTTGGGFTLTGGGTMTLAGANTYLGAATVSAGTLQIGNGTAGSVSNSSALNVSSGATLAFDEATGASQTQSIADGGTVAGAEGAGITNTLSGAINGSGGFAQSGAGITILSGTNTYSGGTTVSAGTLNINGIGALGGANYGGLTFNGGTLLYAAAVSNGSGDLSTGAGITVGAGGGVINTNGNAVTYANSTIGGAGALTIEDTNGTPGSLMISGANSYSGGTTISSGKLIVTNSTGSATGSGNVALNGGTLAGSGIIAGTVTLGGGILAPGAAGTTLTVGGLTYNSGTFSFTFNGTNPSSEVSATNITFNAVPTLSYAGVSTLSNGEVFTLLTSTNPIGNINDVLGITQSVGRLSLNTAQGAGNTVVVDVTGNPANLVWAGGATGLGLTGTPGDGSTWNNTQNNSGNNWNNNGAYDYFYEADNVTFNDTGAPNHTVTLTTVNSPGSVTINTGSTYIFNGSGSIAGSGALTITGGTLDLGTANTYSGGTNINAGTTLQEEVSSALPSTGTVTLSGTLDLNGNNQSIASLAGTGTIEGSAVTTGTLTFSNSSSLAFGGSIGATSANNLNLNVSGGGTVTLSGTNTYAGTTTVSSGALIASSNSALGNSTSSTGGLVMSSNGIVDFTSATPSIAALTGSSGNSIVLGNAAGGSATTLTITGAGAGAATTFAGVISNANASNTVGNVTVSGGNLTLSGVNTYTGATTITSGTLNLAGTLGSGGGTAITNDGTFTETSTGLISGTSTLTNAAGTTTLANANTFIGITLVSGGILALGNSLALQDSTLNLGGGTLSFGTLTAATVAGLTGSGNLALTNTNSAAVTLTIGNTTTSTYSGTLSGAGGLTVGGTAAVILSGSNAYTGGTRINPNATLQLQANAGNIVSGTSYALGPNVGQLNMGGVNGSTSTLQLLSDTSVTFNGGNGAGGLGGTSAGETIVLNVNQLTAAGLNNTISFAPAGFPTFITTIDVTGGNGYSLDLGPITSGNNSTLTLDEISANLIISGGITDVTNLTVEGGFNTSIAGAITNGAATTSTLTKSGAGILTLSGTNTYNGATTVTAGTLQIGNGSGGSLSNSSALSVSSGATLAFDEATGNSQTQNIADAGTVAGAEGSGITNTLSGGISGAGAFTQSGSGTTILSGANTYTGPTTVTAGTLDFANTSSLYNGATASWTASNIIVQNGATLAVQVGSSNFTSANIGTLLGMASSATGGFETGSILGLDTTPGNFTYSGTIANAYSGSTLGLAILGANTLTLTGANTYTGPTKVKAGTLTLGATGEILNNTAVTVANGATLAATPSTGGISIGSAGGASLTLRGGSSLLLGGSSAASAETTTFNTLTLNGNLSIGGSSASAGLTFDLNNTSNDQLVVTGAVSFGADGGVINIIVPNSSTAPSGATLSYTLITAAGGLATGAGAFTLGSGSQNIVLGPNEYTATLGTSGVGGTTETLTLNEITLPLNYYWVGGTSPSWSVPGNFATDHTGAVLQTAQLASDNNVVLTADSPSGANTASQTLDNSYTINSLTFSSTAPATSLGTGTGGNGASNTLTLNPVNGFGVTAGASPVTTTYGSGIGLEMQNGSAAQTLNVPVALGGSQTWEIDSPTNALTVQGAISDGGAGYSLTKTGVGTLILSGSNTYSGGTVVSAGTLMLGSGGSLLPTGALTVNGGTFDLGGNSQTVASLSDGGVSTGTITDSTGAGTLTINNTTPDTYSGTITDQNNVNSASSLALVLEGSSNVTLSGSNSFTGGTTLAGGNLIAASNYALGNPASQNANAGLTFNNSGTANAYFTSANPQLASINNGPSETGPANIILGNTSQRRFANDSLPWQPAAPRRPITATYSAAPSAISRARLAAAVGNLEIINGGFVELTWRQYLHRHDVISGSAGPTWCLRCWNSAIPDALENSTLDL